MAELFDLSSCNFMIGYLFNNTDLYFDSKYHLCKEDFKDKNRGSAFLRILYATGYNLSLQGAKEINAVSVGEFVKNYREQMAILEDNDYMSFIDMVKELSNAEDVSVYYNRIKKMSLLSKYHYELGWDIKKFYDIDKDDASERGKLEGFSIDEIVEYYEKEQIKISKAFITKDETEEMICGDGIEELLDEFEESPMIGASLCSPYLNALYRGWVKNHLILRGSPSGGGKTTIAISDLCTTSSKKIWDENKQDFIDNPCYAGIGAYIHSEQKSREEIQPRFLSTISGIPYHKILDGNFTKEEKERLIEAGHILKDSQLRIINFPDFTANKIRQKLRELKLEHGADFVIQDYIWDNFYLGAELKEISGTPIRQDMSLLHLANTLKLCAEENEQAIETMIQLNGNEREARIVDESCLFGSKQIKTKLDNGSILMPPRPKELKEVDELINKYNKSINNRGFGVKIYPNAISHCFKTRYNRYGQNLKVWHNIDYSTGKVEDMFVTTWDNKPVKVDKLYINNKGCD